MSADTHKTVKLYIDDITCNSCINTITTVLQRHNYINNVSIHLLTKIATIQYQPIHLTINDIIELIDSVGYNATIQLPKHNSPNTNNKSKLTYNQSVNDLPVNKKLGSGYTINIEFCTSCGYYSEYASIHTVIQHMYPMIKVVCNTVPARMKTFEITLLNHNIMIFSKLKTNTFPSDYHKLYNDIESAITQAESKLTISKIVQRFANNLTSSDKLILGVLSSISIGSLILGAVLYNQRSPQHGTIKTHNTW